MNEQELAEIKERYAKLGDEDANIIHRLLEKIEQLNTEIGLVVKEALADQALLGEMIAGSGQVNAELKELRNENAQLRALLEPAEKVCKTLSEYIESGEFFDPETMRGIAEWQALKGGAQSTCKWEHDQDRENDVWETSCGNAVVFDEGEPKEHGYKFCPYCGKLIEFVEQEEGEG